MRIIGIITTKDRIDLFSNAIESALIQSRKLDELIVVSDSNNQNFEYERLMCQKFNAALIKNNNARNYAGSLNTAIYKVISDRLFEEHNFSDTYIALLDDDDLWHSNYLETCENSLTHNEDFVISGINYYNENGTKTLSIPQKLSIDDFLKSNPHIQGSNTFIKFSTVLKSGMFDENMSSTTDRDFFVRVMLLNPSYTVINKWLVDINANNNRERITNSKVKKSDGLQKFYYKYGGLMSNEVKNRFFKRAKHLFQVERRSIETTAYPPTFPEEICYNAKKYCGQLAVGFIATEYDLGLRLLKQLIALQRKKTKIVILINFENNIDEYESLLKQSGYSYRLITHDRLQKDIENNALAGLIVKKQVEKIPICDIAVSRSLLQHYLYCYTKDDDVIWVVDDDMELFDLAKNPANIDGTIEKYRIDYDAVIGNYAQDAPLPTLSTLRTSLLDYAYSKINATVNAASIRLNDDYYYDLTDENNAHLETPLRISSNISLGFIFSGKAAARPLYATCNEVREAKNRGGNTFIFNRKLLKLPNWSLQVSDKIGRRSDYFWVLLAKKQGYKLASIPFSILHNRSESVFNYKKEANKFMLDLIGSSFTKAIELVGLTAEKREFFVAYKNAFVSRLTKYFTSFYRITGLLQIIGDNIYIEEFTTARLYEFIKNTETYINHESVISAFDILRKNLRLQEKMQSRYEIEQELKKYFNMKVLKLLGFGSEGIVFTDKIFLYKRFFEKPNNWDFLKTLSFADCPQMHQIEAIENDGKFVLRYEYSPSTEYNSGYAEQLANLIAFGKKNGFVLTNIKRQNFIVANGQLKMIDYGHSVEAFCQEKYLRSIKRAYQMLRYSFLNEEEFSNLIALHYSGKKAEAIDCGYQNFELLVHKRQKETIHDTYIIDLLRLPTTQKIIDYGAGKCKIANHLACNNDVTVYDIDNETLHKRVVSNVRIVDTMDSLACDSFDIVLNNLVLCCTENEVNADILADITRLLKISGRAIISICCPFFNEIERTELRITGNHGQYQNANAYEKHSRYGNIIKREYHRPIEYYENLLQRYGLEIQNIIECNGVDTETVLPIAEHIVFDCFLANKNSLLPDCSLLIKTNPMEHNTIYSSIRHIVGRLEKGIRFFERIVTVDMSAKKNRVRRYDEDNIDVLLSELNRAKSNGLIDRIISANEQPEAIYQKYFGITATNPHASNGQGLYATLRGFDEINTPIVFQTDSDILYKNSTPNEFLTVLQKSRNAVTVSLSIAHKENAQESYGERTEARSSFINLERLKELLPLPNYADNNTLQLAWHRALDKKLNPYPAESIRLHSKGLFFIHPQNTQKTIPNFIAYAKQSIEKNALPQSQYSSVDLTGTPEEWLCKTNATVVLYIRGFNTPPTKTKRLLDTLRQQTYQDYFIVYVDDASQNGSADYAKFILENDCTFKDKSLIVCNSTNTECLANFVMAMQNIIINPKAIVINIDNDDCLTANNAIERIVTEFNNGADITCGNCLRRDKPLKEYKIYSFNKTWERNGDNIWLHPKCFRRKLFDYTDIESDLKINGKFVSVNTDFAFMLPMIEHSAKSVFISDTLYYFEPSTNNQISHGKYKKENKEKIRNMLLQKARRNYEKNNSGNR